MSDILSPIDRLLKSIIKESVNSAFSSESGWVIHITLLLTNNIGL